MPELPEIEKVRRLIEEAAVDKKISEVFVAADALWLAGVPAARAGRFLTGRTVRAVHRKGKHFWLELDTKPWPVLHFGMSGDLEIYDSPMHRPSHCKLELTIGGKRRLGFRDPRRFGRLKFTDNPLALPSIARMGFDAMNELPGAGEFAALIGQSKRNIKALLLDQSFAAGIGNYLADEVLLQAGVSPHRSSQSLTRHETDSIRQALKSTIHKAVEAYRRNRPLPKSWLIHTRWNARLGSREDGLSVIRETIAGRTTVWVPELQS